MKLGVDIGTSMTKAVLMEGAELVWWFSVPTEANPGKAMEAVFSAMGEQRGLAPEALEGMGVSGWGAKVASEGWQKVETVLAMGKAASWYLPAARTVLTAGAQESIIVSIDERGSVIGYARNDKCASGAGRFLDIICEPLECEVADMEALARQSTKKLEMSAQCAVFAESEVVSRINDGEAAADICNAVLDTVARNVATLSRKITAKPEYVVGGGLLSNAVVVERLSKLLDVKMHVFEPDAKLITAIGAALCVKGGRP